MKTIRLDGTIGYEITASWLAEQIAGETELTLIVNSGGGSILEGFAIYNLLRDFAGTITARVDLAASMASVIVMAADKVIMRGASSLMMIHKPWTGAVGDAEELRGIADTLDKMETMILDIYMGKAGGKVERKKMEKMLSAETWLDGSEAVAIGLADSVETDNAKNMMSALLAAMSAQQVIHYGLDKMAEKIESAESGKTIFDSLKSCEKLADVENVLKMAYNASNAEVLAIISTVKKCDKNGERLEREKTEIQNTINNFLSKI